MTDYKDCKDRADLWAEFFIRTLKKNKWNIDDIDESLMLGWFANAIELSHDYRSQPPEDE